MPAFYASALFTGACRSGKSRLAQEWAERRHPRRVYIATAAIRDVEMAARVALHQQSRGEGWQTVEVPPQPDPAALLHALGDLPSDTGSVLLDCTTLWLAGLMEQGLDDDALLACVDALAARIPGLPFHLAIVHNETGWGLVPEHPLGRRFRDLSGLAGQRLARACDGVTLAVCGLPLTIKGHLE